MKSNKIMLPKKVLTIIFYLLIMGTPAFCEKVYDFSDEAQDRFNNQYNYQLPTSPLPSSNTIKSKIQYIPAGTVLMIMLNGEVSSDKHTVGTQITAQLINDFFNNGVLIAPEGSIVSGTIVEVKGSDITLKNGQVGLEFYQLLLPDGTVYQITTNRLYTKMQSLFPKAVGEGVILPTARVGLNNFFLGGNIKSLASGVIIGGIASVVDLLGQKGSEALLPEGTTFQVRLLNAITAHPYEF